MTSPEGAEKFLKRYTVMSKIILVDDEILVLNSVKKYITNFLPELEICGLFFNGEDALHYMIEHPVDIVVTDICMPHMDGLELAREICNRFPYCITIIVSGYSEFEYARTAIKYNVSNYLLKPLDFRELQKCLSEAQALSSSRHNPSAVDIDLRQEAIELFFVDLLMGIIPSADELESKFSSLKFPFPLNASEGNLLKISVCTQDMDPYWDHHMDRLEVSLKNILRLSLPGIPFYFVRRSDLDFYYIMIDHNLPSEQTITKLEHTTKELLHLKCTIAVHQHFTTLNDFLSDRQPQAPKAKKAFTDDTVIQKAIDYIESHYAENLTREMVADAVFLSPSYFSFQFKKKTGISFFDYLTNIRMQKAIELLKTKMKISDIAVKVGYNSRNRFLINFRQYTDYAPTEYRKKILCMEDSNETENS